MRTIRTKQSKKKRHEIKEVKDPVRALSILSKIALDYLTVHSAAWKQEGAYLKPFYKGTITMTINRLNKFISTYDNLPGAMEIESKKNVIRGIVIEKMEEIENFKLNTNNTVIYKTMALASICIEVIDKESKRLGFAYAKQQLEIGKIVKAFEGYKDFWRREIDPLVINYD